MLLHPLAANHMHRHISPLLLTICICIMWFLKVTPTIGKSPVDHLLHFSRGNPYRPALHSSSPHACLPPSSIRDGCFATAPTAAPLHRPCCPLSMLGTICLHHFLIPPSTTCHPQCPPAPPSLPHFAHPPIHQLSRSPFRPKGLATPLLSPLPPPQVTSSSAVCVSCFKAGDHEGHDYVLYRSPAGGCCDCGDPASWNLEGEGGGAGRAGGWKGWVGGR